MNKSAIKAFAITARQKLINQVTYQAGLLGITQQGIAQPHSKTSDTESYDIGGSNLYHITGPQLEKRQSLVLQVKAKGFAQVMEEVAYTWFNRLIAIRFMEVNDYLPTRLRVLSSETPGKQEPDIVTHAPQIGELHFTPAEVENILQLKNDNKADQLFSLLFLKQCNALNAILPGLFEPTTDYTELLFSISYTNPESVVSILIRDIDEADFREQVEIIGWLYQYYISERKDQR